MKRLKLERIVEILQDLGYSVPNSYVDFIKNFQQVWKKWYRGHDENFHNYKSTGGERQSLDRVRSKLNMGKTVAEDWANFLLNEKTYIQLEDDNAQKYLVGDETQQEKGILGKNNFWTLGNRLVERTFAQGTSAILLTIENATLEGEVITEGEIKLKYIKSAERIIPIAWDNDEIIDCIFVTTYTKEKKDFFNIQVHERMQEGYRISNREFMYDDNEYTEIAFEGVKSFLSPTKMFVIMSPNIENNYVDDLPMGISIYSSSLDPFKSGDLAYTNFDKDFLLGGKKIFVSQDGVAGTMKDGKFTPSIDDTAEDSLYVVVPSRMNDDRLFEEFNPSIRVDENVNGIQLALNLISVKCKLGPNFYVFDSESKSVYKNTSSTKANTKTLYDSVNKQRIMITNVLNQLVSSILSLAHQLGEEVDENTQVSIQFDDTYFNDNEAERNRDLQEVRDGIMAKYEYRMKWYGETEDEAKQKVKEMEEPAQKVPGFFDA